MAYPEDKNIGLFIPTTNVWDTDLDDEELQIRLYQNLSLMANTINLKDSGYYSQQEFVNGQAYFPDPTLSSGTPTVPVYRQVFRKVVDFGALPNAATKSVAHGISITNTFSFTRIYAAASDPIALLYFPIPGNGVNITVDVANVNITTTVNLSSYTKCYVVLEYIKQ